MPCSKYVHEEGLKKHCFATGAVMRALAARFGKDTECRETIGILHDIVFALFCGDMQQHGTKGAEILKAHGIEPELARIVQRHNHVLTGTYERPVEIALQACG